MTPDLTGISKLRTIGLWSGRPDDSHMLIWGWRRQIFGHNRIKSLLEEANMDPCESLLQYVGGKEDGSQEAKSLLSFHPYSSKDFQMGREQSSWLKSPPMITGPGHEAVAVTLVL